MLLANKKTIIVTTRVIGVAVYQHESTEFSQYASMYLDGMPENIMVNDNQICDLPKEQKYWEPFALSCFSYHETAIPIIDLAYLFSEEFNAIKHRA